MEETGPRDGLNPVLSVGGSFVALALLVFGLGSLAHGFVMVVYPDGTGYGALLVGLPFAVVGYALFRYVLAADGAEVDGMWTSPVFWREL